MLGNVYTKEFDIMKLHGNVYKEQSVLCYGLKWVFFFKEESVRVWDKCYEKITGRERDIQKFIQITHIFIAFRFFYVFNQRDRDTFFANEICWISNKLNLNIFGKTEIVTDAIEKFKFKYRTLYEKILILNKSRQNSLLINNRFGF